MTTPVADQPMHEQYRSPGHRGARIVASVMIMVLSMLGLAACGATATTNHANSTVGQIDLPALMLDAQDMRTAGLTVSKPASRVLTADQVYETKGALGDIQTSNFVQGRYNGFSLPELEGGEAGVLIIVYRTAKWAQDTLDEERKSDADVGHGKRLNIARNSKYNGMRLDGTKGRVRIIVQMGATSQSFDPGRQDVQGRPVRSWVEDLWTRQAAQLPTLADVPADAGHGPKEIGEQFGRRQGMFTAIVLFAVMVIGSLAGVLRDRGSRELLALMAGSARPTGGRPAMTLTDISAPIRRGAWAGLFKWSGRTVVVSLAYGLLTWKAPRWWMSLITMAVLLALISIVRTAAGKNRDLPQLPRWARTITIAGTAAAGFVVAAGCLMIVGGIDGALILGARPGIFASLLIPIVLVGIGIMTRGRQVARFGQRLVQPAVREAIQADRRRPVMLLRSFADDSLEVRASSRLDGFTEAIAAEGYARFEETIAEALLHTGPVIALGQPGTVLQPLGAVREYFTDAQWQEAVENRNADARFIAVVCGRSPALMWEIAEIRRNARLAKTLFILPPVPRKELQPRLRVLWSALSLDPEVLPDRMNAYPLVLHFLASGQPCMHLCRARTEDAYVTAIRQAATEADTADAAPLSDPAPASRGRSEDVSAFLVGFDPDKVARPRRTLAYYLQEIALRL